MIVPDDIWGVDNDIVVGLKLLYKTEELLRTESLADFDVKIGAKEVAKDELASSDNLSMLSGKTLPVGWRVSEEDIVRSSEVGPTVSDVPKAVWSNVAGSYGERLERDEAVVVGMLERLDKDFVSKIVSRCWEGEVSKNRLEYVSFEDEW